MEDQEDSFNKYYFDIKGFVLCALVGMFLLKIMVIFWWRPRKIEQHFSKQGIKGPSYKFLIGNAKEIMSLMMKASSKPMPFPFSHNILPRVLSFYHHWKKIYGMFMLISHFLYITSLHLFSFQSYKRTINMNLRVYLIWFNDLKLVGFDVLVLDIILYLL